MSHTLGYFQMTSLAAATTITQPANPAQYAAKAIVQVEGAPVRWRDDGVDPTATVGMRLLAGEELNYDGPFPKLKFIQESTGAKLNIYYEAI